MMFSPYGLRADIVADCACCHGHAASGTYTLLMPLLLIDAYAFHA